MHRILVFITTVIVLLAPAFGEQEDVNILFLGNSFTFRHDLDQLVKKVIEEGQPGLKVHAERVVYGGMSMYQHSELFFSQTFIEQHTIKDQTIRDRIQQMENLLELEEPPAEYVHFWKEIRGSRVMKEFPRSSIEKAIRDHRELLKNNPRTKWDYVVLQSWQDVYPDIDQGYSKHARFLAAIAGEQGAKVILYVTAPDIQNAEPVTQPQLQDRVDREIKVILELAKSIEPFAVVHVPLAVNLIQKGGTDLTFCYVNDFHPNQTCAFLTSNMFYAALFKQGTVGFAYNSVTETNPKEMGPGKDPDGNDATVVFDLQTKEYLQRMAHEAVMAFDRLWQR